MTSIAALSSEKLSLFFRIIEGKRALRRFINLVHVDVTQDFGEVNERESDLGSFLREQTSSRTSGHLRQGKAIARLFKKPFLAGGLPNRLAILITIVS